MPINCLVSFRSYKAFLRFFYTSIRDSSHCHFSRDHLENAKIWWGSYLSCLPKLLTWFRQHLWCFQFTIGENGSLSHVVSEFTYYLGMKGKLPLHTLLDVKVPFVFCLYLFLSTDLDPVLEVWQVEGAAFPQVIPKAPTLPSGKDQKETSRSLILRGQ